MASGFLDNRPLYTKIWGQRTRSIIGKDSVRACITNMPEKFTIDVSYYNREDHLADKAPAQLKKSLIEIELPNGKTWSGTITELQALLLDTAK